MESQALLKGILSVIAAVLIALVIIKPTTINDVRALFVSVGLVMMVGGGAVVWLAVNYPIK